MFLLATSLLFFSNISVVTLALTFCDKQRHLLVLDHLIHPLPLRPEKKNMTVLQQCPRP